MDRFLRFEKFVTPVLVRVIFWVGFVACILFGLFLIEASSRTGYYGYRSEEKFYYGVLLILFGPVYFRILCEGMLVVFRMNHNLEKQNQITEKLNQTVEKLHKDLTKDK